METVKLRYETLRTSILATESLIISKKLRSMNEKVSDDLARKIDCISDEKKDFVTESFIFLAR
jgi:hypothetical protein